MPRTLAVRVTSQIATRFRLWRQEVSYPVILQSMIARTNEPKLAIVHSISIISFSCNYEVRGLTTDALENISVTTYAAEQNYE